MRLFVMQKEIVACESHSDHNLNSRKDTFLFSIYVDKLYNNPLFSNRQIGINYQPTYLEFVKT